MIVHLICGCTVNDARKSTLHLPNVAELPDRRSTRDVEANHHHWPLGSTPTSLCISCDYYRPCPCDNPVIEVVFPGTVPAAIRCCHIQLSLISGEAVSCTAPSEWTLHEKNQHPSEAGTEACTEHLSEMVGENTVSIDRRAP